ncbi:hypothetical protein [Spiroplasma endosymbiont of Amphibalanus improvisus]|uniref:hypothetical protein n=1 Tax=Spiroplasma endosymbiont of Amphibalanus improvisus TaxID=3066327 RepID=UPI00313E2E78
MKLVIKNYFGIKNKIEIPIKNKNVIFAPNGVGKTSIAKALQHGIGNKNKSSLTFDELKLSKNVPESSYISFLDDNDNEIHYIKNNNSNFMDYKSNVLWVNDDKINKLNINDHTLEKIEVEKIIYNTISDKYYKQFSVLIYEDLIEKYKNAIKYIEGKIPLSSNIKRLGFIYGYLYEDIVDPINDHSDYIEELITDLKSFNSKKIKKTIEDNLNLIQKSDDYKNSLNNKDNFDTTLIKEIVLFLADFVNGKKTCYGKKIYNENIFKFNEQQDLDNSTISYKEIKNSLEKYKEYLFLECVLIYFQNNNIQLNKIFDDIENNKINFPYNFNSIADELNNNLLKASFLKWNIKIKHITQYKENLKLINYNDDEELDITTNINFSTGQIKVLKTILYLIQSDQYELIIMDDIFTSLDLDNTQLLVNYFMGLKKKWILLTHNYNLFTNLIFSINNSELEKENIQASFLDTYGNEQIIVTSIKPEEINDLQKNSCLLKLETSCEKSKALFCATIFHEIIDQYFNDFDDNEIKKIKDFLNKNYRHFKKSNTNFSDFASKFSNTISAANFAFQNMIYLKIIAVAQSDEKITNFVLNYNPLLKFKNILDYIINKYMLALQIRFKIEKIEKEIKNSSSDNNKIVEWNEQLILSVEHILHLNNLRWDAIFETPLYKLKKYYDLIQEKNKY